MDPVDTKVNMLIHLCVELDTTIQTLGDYFGSNYQIRMADYLISMTRSHQTDIFSDEFNFHNIRLSVIFESMLIAYLDDSTDDAIFDALKLVWSYYSQENTPYQKWTFQQSVSELKNQKHTVHSITRHLAVLWGTSDDETNAKTGKYILRSYCLSMFATVGMMHTILTKNSTTTPGIKT